MLRVELIYDKDCPNIHLARKALLEGFGEAGLAPSWLEWDRKSSESPAHVRLYGSPTILVNGRDVVGITPSGAADSCRIYDHGLDGLRGAPPAHTIASVLRSDGPDNVISGVALKPANPELDKTA